MTNDNTFVRSLDAAGPVPMADATTAIGDTAGSLKQQPVFEWLFPALTAGIIVLGALEGEQRPSRVVAGTLDRLNPVS